MLSFIYVFTHEDFMKSGDKCVDNVYKGHIKKLSFRVIFAKITCQIRIL